MRNTFRVFSTLLWLCFGLLLSGCSEPIDDGRPRVKEQVPPLTRHAVKPPGRNEIQRKPMGVIETVTVEGLRTIVTTDLKMQFTLWGKDSAAEKGHWVDLMTLDPHEITSEQFLCIKETTRCLSVIQPIRYLPETHGVSQTAPAREKPPEAKFGD